MTIRGLIFDFGGVILDMKWEVARHLANEHGLPDRLIVESLYGSDTWRRIEVGDGDREAWLRDAHAALESHAGRPLPPLHQHWRERQGFIGENIDLIRRLRGSYKTQLLSNADRTLAERIRAADGGLAGLFDDIVVSADVGLAKPDPRIYALAAARLGLPPAACVFIDDVERNTAAAEAAGMHTVHYRVDRGDSLEAQLAALDVRAAAAPPGRTPARDDRPGA